MMGCFEKFLNKRKHGCKISAKTSVANGHAPKKIKKHSKSLTHLSDLDIRKDNVIQNGQTTDGVTKPRCRRITIGSKPQEELKKLGIDDTTIQEKTKKASSNYRNSYLNSQSHTDMLFAGTVGSTLGSLSGTKLLATIVDDNKTVDDDIFKNFDFPFTNLVFEGGGNKGMAYVGALQVSVVSLLIFLFLFTLSLENFWTVLN